MNKVQLIVLCLAGLLVFGLCNFPASGAAKKEQPKRQLTLSERTPDYKKYFPSKGETTLINRSMGDVRVLLGAPAASIHEGSYQDKNYIDLWIYRLSTEDASGAYLYFKGGTVKKSWIDEFNGLIMKQYGSYIGKE